MLTNRPHFSSSLGWLVGFTLSLLSSLISAEELRPLSDEKRQLIDRLFALHGAANISAEMAKSQARHIKAQLRRTNPQLDDQALALVEKEVQQFMHHVLQQQGGLRQLFHPLYHRYFSTEEIRQILDFYRSPAGKKAISLLPTITEEGKLAGQMLGQSLAPKIREQVAKRLEKEGITLHRR